MGPANPGDPIPYVTDARTSYLPGEVADIYGGHHPVSLQCLESTRVRSNPMFGTGKYAAYDSGLASQEEGSQSGWLPRT